jgi:murein DD-endopeptidase MepM/ murein hydrolase activator NlpD
MPNYLRTYSGILIFFIIIVFVNAKIIEITGNCTVKYDNNEVSFIETKENATIIFDHDKQTYIVLPESEIEINSENKLFLLKGSFENLTISKSKINFTIKKIEPLIWGNSVFYRIKLDTEINDLTGSVKINYFNSDKEIPIDTKIHFLFDNNGSKYYGFFVPHYLEWETEKVILDMQFMQNGEILLKFIDEIPVESRSFEKQTVSFEKNKSSQLEKIDRKKYEKERDERQKIWEENNSKIYFNTGFVLPLKDDSYISSEFGLERDWKLNSGKTYSVDTHLGIDFARDKGVNVHASAGGIVRYVRNGEYVGNIVIIEHGLSFFTNYYHLNKILVKEGEIVKKGSIIATVGKTGAATGPHLHWEARIYQIPVDPRCFLAIDQIFIP